MVSCRPRIFLLTNLFSLNLISSPCLLNCLLNSGENALIAVYLPPSDMSHVNASSTFDTFFYRAREIYSIIYSNKSCSGKAAQYRRLPNVTCNAFPMSHLPIHVKRVVMHHHFNGSAIILKCHFRALPPKLEKVGKI